METVVWMIGGTGGSLETDYSIVVIAIAQRASSTNLAGFYVPRLSGGYWTLTSFILCIMFRMRKESQIVTGCVR